MTDNERHPFGGGIGDWVFQTSEGGVVSVAPGAVVTFSNARDGGSAYTSLSEDAAGTTLITSVVSSDGSLAGYVAGDYPIFYGPPGVRFMWASADGGPRKIIFANDMAEDLARAILVDIVTTAGDLIAGVGLGQVERVPGGTNGQVLTWDSAQTRKVKWATPAGGGGGGSSVATTSDTLWVAASDAPDQFADAPYQCDGTADQVEIQAALNNALGLRVGLSPGTFNLAAPINLLGVDNVDAEVSKYLTGAGTYATTLVAASGIAGAIFLGQAVCPHVADLRIQIVGGATHGIYSARSAAALAGNRSFFHGSIRNIAVAGPASGTHTGWALSLGSGFRYTVDNIEVYGTGNGIRVLNESSAFNCGDAAFRRCFVEVIGTNATAYHVSSPTGNANQLSFDTCHGYAAPASTGTVMWKFDGAGATSHVRVRNSNAEQFDTTVSIAATAMGIDVDMVHVTQVGGTFAAVAGYSNRVSVGELYVPSGTCAAITETNGYATKPNEFRVDVYAETGSTVTASLLSGVITRGVSDGGGSVANVLKQKQQRGIVIPFTKGGAITSAPATGTYKVYNDSGNDRILRSVRAGLGVAYTTGSTIVDININGATIFSNQANRPTIAANATNSGRVTTGVDGIVWAAGAYISVDIDAIGSAGAGADLIVQIDTYN